LSHSAFLVFCLAELLFLLVRRRGTDLAMCAMLGGALAFTASFFFVSIACDYRYLYLLDLAALSAAFHIAADPRIGSWRRGRASPAPPRTGEETAGAMDSSV
jgi:hypothetical protein